MFGQWRLRRKGKQGKGLVTASKKRGGEFERDFTLGNFFTGTSLSPGAGGTVPIRFDPGDPSNFIVDEKQMVDEQKAWLDRKKRESEEFDQHRAQEAEKDLPLN